MTGRSRSIAYVSLACLTMAALNACSEPAREPGGESANGEGFRDGLRVVSSDTGSAVTRVSSEGAIVALSSGAEVAVPAGAVEEEVEIAVQSVTSGYPRVDAPSLGDVVAFLPHGVQFARPVMIRLPYDVSLGAQSLYTSDPGGQWEEVAGARFEGGIASAEVTHFSFFFTHPQLTREQLLPGGALMDAGGGMGGSGSDSSNAGAGGSDSAGAGGNGGTSGSSTGGSSAGGTSAAGSGSGGTSSSPDAGAPSGGASSGGAGSSGGGSDPTHADAGPDASTGTADAGVDECEGTDAGIASGDVYIGSMEDAAQLTCVREIQGTLSVYQTCQLEALELPHLERITGNLQVGYTNVQSLSFPALQEVSGDFQIANAGALGHLDVSALAHVGGSLYLGENASITSFSAPSLETVSGAVSLQGNCALETADLPALVSAESLTLHSNVAQTSFAAPALGSLQESLEVIDCSLLPSLQLSDLASVGASSVSGGSALRVYNNAALDTLSLPSLGAVGVTVHVENNCALASASMPSLDSVTSSSFTVAGSATLPQSDLDALSQRLTTLQYAGTLTLTRDACSSSGPQCFAVDTCTF